MDCRKVEEQGDECEVYVVMGASSFYQNLRFALLASSWLPLPLGILIWSALHLVLLFCVTSLLVAVFSFLLCFDTFMQVLWVLMYIGYGFFIWDIAVLLIDTLRWLLLMMWVIISCQATPGKAANVAYERIAGIRFFRCAQTLFTTPSGTGWKWKLPQFSALMECCSLWAGPEPGAPVEAGEAGAVPGELAEAVEVGPDPGELAEVVEVGPDPGELVEVREAECCGECPFSRSRLKTWCKEIVPLYDVVRV